MKKKYAKSSSINFLIIEKVLPDEVALKLSEYFPKEDKLKQINGPQEKKYIGFNFSDKEKLIEECIYAFQEESVVEKIGEITAIENLIGDPELYAGGISSMSKGCFLNPHIDNSHDRNLEKYRRLNLLYYLNKDWDTKVDGGDLVLFPNGIKNEAIEISCYFNRLVIMRTDNKSLHGVNKIQSELKRRKCISNYYFSKKSPTGEKYYHSTSFRGFKKEYIKGTYLKINALSRTYTKKLIYKLTNKSFSTKNYRNK